MHLHNNAATGDYWYTCDQCSSIVEMQQKARQGTSPRERGGQTHVTNSPFTKEKPSTFNNPLSISLFYFSSVLSRGLINDCKTTTTKKITVIYLNTESNNRKA